MADRTTTSCFSSVKESLLYLARNCRLLAPLLLCVVVVAVKFVYITPLSAEMGRHITEMEQHTNPSSADYARLLETVRHQARVILLIPIATALVLLTLAFAKQIVACFTTCSGDRYSLTELLRQVVKYAKGPLVIVAVVTMLQATSSALVGAYFDAISDAEVISVLGILAVVLCLANLWFCYAVTVIVVASVVDDVEVADEGCCGGMCCLREAWRLVRQVRTKEALVPVLVSLLLPTVLIPLYAVALLCTEQSTWLGLYLLSAYRYTLVSNVIDLYYIMAASAYWSQGCNSLAMESSELVVATDDEYAQIPSGEENI